MKLGLAHILRQAAAQVLLSLCSCGANGYHLLVPQVQARGSAHLVDGAIKNDFMLPEDLSTASSALRAAKDALLALLSRSPTFVLHIDEIQYFAAPSTFEPQKPGQSLQHYVLAAITDAAFSIVEDRVRFVLTGTDTLTHSKLRTSSRAKYTKITPLPHMPAAKVQEITERYFPPVAGQTALRDVYESLAGCPRSTQFFLRALARFGVGRVQEAAEQAFVDWAADVGAIYSNLHVPRATLNAVFLALAFSSSLGGQAHGDDGRLRPHVRFPKGTLPAAWWDVVGSGALRLEDAGTQERLYMPYPFLQRWMGAQCSLVDQSTVQKLSNLRDGLSSIDEDKSKGYLLQLTGRPSACTTHANPERVLCRPQWRSSCCPRPPRCTRRCCRRPVRSRAQPSSPSRLGKS